MAVVEGAQRGYQVDHVVRQIHPDDFARFDLIVAMDRNNVDDLERLRGGVDQRHGHYADVEPVQLQLLRRWDPFAMPGDEDCRRPVGQAPAGLQRDVRRHRAHRFLRWSIISPGCAASTRNA